MTPLFAAISVLQGFQHSISSHLESLFYSLYYVALNSKLPAGEVFTAFSKCDLWWQARLGAMSSSTPSELDRIQDQELKAFMSCLHNVFFEWDQDKGSCTYRVDVSPEDVQAVCKGDGVIQSSYVFNAR